MQGNQHPRILSVPPQTSSVGAEAVQLAREAGLILDPWQAFVLENALGIRDRRWSAFEVGLVVPRQNGKGSILEARELAGLFLLGERLLIHSAHQFDTSLEAFRRLLFLVEDNSDFSRRVKRVSRSHGEEGIELLNGQRIRFRTRTKGGGRGFSSDCLILDEAMILPDASHAALLPTLSARPNPQVWYTGSAVDQEVHEDGMVLARVRSRGIEGGDPSLAYFEWSVDAEDPDDVPDEVRRSPERIAEANPGLGIRIAPDYVEKERASMDSRGFNTERLNIGDWPNPNDDGAVISLEAWLALGDTASMPIAPFSFGFNVTPNRGRASIGVAARRRDGLAHVEVLESKRGTGWLVDRMVELCEKHNPSGVYFTGAASRTLATDLMARGVETTELSPSENAEACGLFFDAAEQGKLRHLVTPELVGALRIAVRRKVNDAWEWDRRAAGDISSLVATTVASWGVLGVPPEEEDLGFAVVNL